MDYIALIRKNELVNFYKYGWTFPYFPYVQIDCREEELSAHPEYGKDLFTKTNPLDYSIEGYLLLISTSNPIDTKERLFINQIHGVYALDKEAYNIGIHLSPAIKLNPPLWEDVYSDFCIQGEVRDAEIGVENIFKIFGLEQPESPLTVETVEIFRNLSKGISPKGKHSIWYYLLQYNRHHPYPKGNLGYAFDALQVFINYKNEKEVDDSVFTISPESKRMLRCNTNKMKDIQEAFIASCPLAMKTNEIESDYMLISSLFLMLKEIFKDGIDVSMKVLDKYDIQSFAEKFRSQKDVSLSIKEQALYLLGLTLGREGTYKYIYSEENLPILEK